MPARGSRQRARDRRTRFGDFLAYVVGALHHGRETRELRLRFEEGLRKLLPLRSAALRIAPLDNRGTLRGGGTLALDVPGGPVGSATIEAVIDSPSALDEWDVQALRAARHVAALIVEIERCRMALPLRRFPEADSPPLIGSGGEVRALRERIARVAATDFTILIEGESGAGKELVARHIHDLSRRSGGPFVAVNCAAIVDTLLEAELFGIEDRTATGVRGRRGKFELAHQGTLFLDEVADLSPSAQAKLLRAIQDLSVERVGGHALRRVDTRIVAATNRSLLEMVEKGRFRADLYYRLNGVEIRVPPLRWRREDIPELATFFLERHAEVRRLKLTAGALDALMAYDWPGNVRELERVMERAIALAQGDEIRPEDLPSRISDVYVDVLMPSLDGNDTLRMWASRYTRLVLERHKNNKRAACRALGISYHTLRAYLRHGRPPEPPRPYRRMPKETEEPSMETDR
jgi:transcriptional regulator with PAS, ATPase and Fis domain